MAALELGADGGESIVDVGSQSGLHRACRCEGNHSYYQRILDQVLTIFVSSTRSATSRESFKNLSFIWSLLPLGIFLFQPQTGLPLKVAEREWPLPGYLGNYL